jgi:hypothetical protein
MPTAAELLSETANPLVREVAASVAGTVPVARKIEYLPIDYRIRALAFQKRITGEPTMEAGKVWWAGIQFPDLLAVEFTQAVNDAVRVVGETLRFNEEKLPCGHRRANEIGDEGGTPYCEVCRALAQGASRSSII